MTNKATAGEQEAQLSWYIDNFKSVIIVSEPVYVYESTKVLPHQEGHAEDVTNKAIPVSKRCNVLWYSSFNSVVTVYIYESTRVGRHSSTQGAF